MTLYMYTVRAADSPGPGCVRERRQWRRQNGNYVQRRVSGTRTFGRRAARARVLSVCVRTRSRASVCVCVCVDKHFKGSSPLHPFSRWSLKCVYTHTNIYIYIHTDASSDARRSSPLRIIYGLRNPVRPVREQSEVPRLGVPSPPYCVYTHTHPHTILYIYYVYTSFSFAGWFRCRRSFRLPDPRTLTLHHVRRPTSRLGGVKRVESQFFFPSP